MDFGCICALCADTIPKTNPNFKIYDGYLVGRLLRADIKVVVSRTSRQFIYFDKLVRNTKEAFTQPAMNNTPPIGVKGPSHL